MREVGLGGGALAPLVVDPDPRAVDVVAAGPQRCLPFPSLSLKNAGEEDPRAENPNMPGPLGRPVVYF